jgi:hypothetical protein
LLFEYELRWLEIASSSLECGESDSVMESKSGMINQNNKLDKERAEKLRRIQNDVRKYVPQGVSLVDELLEERCWEVAKEEQENHGYGSIEYWLEIVRKRRAMTTRG